MDLRARLVTTAGAEEVFAWVDDLARYPAWLSILRRAEPEAPEAGEDGTGAWWVDLRARLGPMSRSKRLRMVRTVYRPPEEVLFERRERDGRHHSRWVLRATVTSEGPGSVLTMELHYGGGRWEPVVERLLRTEVDAARAQLSALLEGG